MPNRAGVDPEVQVGLGQERVPVELEVHEEALLRELEKVERELPAQPLALARRVV